MDTEKNCDIYSKPQVALYCALRFKDLSKYDYRDTNNSNPEKDVILLVANTHLLFNNNRGDIKLGQIHLMMKGVNYLKKKLEEEHPHCTVNTIFCGDFNSLPNSGIYHYISEGFFD